MHVRNGIYTYVLHNLTIFSLKGGSTAHIMRPIFKFPDLILLVSLNTLRKSGFTEIEQFHIINERNVKCIYDGSSIPLKAKFSYKDVFTPACEKHDMLFLCKY